MDKEKLLDLLDRQTFAYHEMQPESPEDYTVEYKKGYNEGLKFAIAYIDQLDEAEVLSQEWIEKYTEYADAVSENSYKDVAVVRIDKLQSLLVPKQELPVIPQFVAEWIEEAKRNESWGIVGLINSFRNGIIQAPFKTRKYFDENQRNVILAYLDGYTVEEPLYRARLKVITGEFIASYLRTQSSDAEDRLKALEIGSKYIHEDYRHLSEFTEDELKRLGIWDSEQWE